MGRYGDLGGSQFTVDNGLRTVKTGFWPSGTTPGGSGASLCDWFIENMFRFCIHEYGHYLQGGNDQHVGHGFWGLLSGWGIKNFVANSFERYRLGWINLNTVQASPNQTIQNATLPDFVTSGVAYRLVCNEATKEYLYIENHQKTSFWENNQMFLRSPYGNVENGVYVLRQDTAGGDNTFIKCITADGRWNWTVNQRVPNPWGSNPPLLPVFKRLSIDRVNGYSDLDLIPWTWNGVNQAPAYIHFTENVNGSPVVDIRHNGDGKDGFRMDYNQMFSPYSNPNSQRLNKTATPFGFNINGFNSGVASLDIYVGTALNGPPSKPQNLQVTASSTNHPELTWEANIEPDKSYYKVYKYSNSEFGWQFLGIAATPYYQDVSVSYCTPGQYCPEHTIKYRVTCIDIQSKESVPSDSVMTSVRGFAEQKIISNSSIENLPSEYSLSTNYPNPFNPVTTIKYDIIGMQDVKVTIYDILGREVKTLVNEQQQPGSYTIKWDASNVSSGVYFYQLKTKDYTNTKKMILLR